MRLSGIVTSDGKLVLGTLGYRGIEHLRTLVSDRVANGDAFPGERPIHFPRAFWVSGGSRAARRPVVRA